MLVCVDKLFCTTKITTFLSKSKFGIEKSECESTLMLHPDKGYLSESAFLVSVTASNKQLFNVKLLLKSRDQVCNYYAVKNLILFYAQKIVLNNFLQILQLFWNYEYK